MDKRQSVTVKAARLVQKLPIGILRGVEWPFLLSTSVKKDSTPAIFVFALPRSGSTVTYQSICHGLSVNYLSNFWNLFYQLPLIGGWLSSKLATRHESDFTSQHGFVSGLGGPAEGLAFWSWWLGSGLSEEQKHVINPERIEKRASYLRQVLTYLGKQNAPFVSAYLGHSLVPDRVDMLFPGSILIRLHREPVANALSILKSLRQSNSNWFSIKPKECNGAEKGAEHFAVASQVYWLNKRLEEAKCSSRMLLISYEALCEDPRKEIGRIVEKCAKQGINVKYKFTLPSKFNCKKADLINNKDAIKIKEELDKLEAQYGELRKLFT
ncbi:sulfotransferase [Idiomarina piscisalsi]|uniref:sulfotransferase n=1 Tax=Idiomarina piscisalsi TaxID=1096243 RepID=UPI001381487B|nr:sulfotransferase [Idiomarina piscisalsi]MTJ02277.1 sulfotransferase [Idiomarina piscisalsi]